MSAALKAYAFISYASEDRKRIAPIVKKLAAFGFDIWIDYKCLIGGQKFSFIIERAFQKAAVIVIFLSCCSIGKTGFFRQELNWAEERLKQTPEGKITIIPVLLDAAITLPDFLRPLHYLKRSDKGFYKKLSQAMTAAGCAKAERIVAAAQEPEAAKPQPILYKLPKKRTAGLKPQSFRKDYFSLVLRHLEKE